VTVSGEEGVLHGLADLIGLGLPCAQTNGGDLVAGVEGVGLPIEIWLMESTSLVEQKELTECVGSTF
jgi:hypothetical protein